MKEWKNERKKERKKERKNERKTERMKERNDIRTNVRCFLMLPLTYLHIELGVTRGNDKMKRFIKNILKQSRNYSNKETF